MTVSSSVLGLDTLVEGGIPSGAGIIIQDPAGPRKNAFPFRFIVGPRGGAAAFVALSSSPARCQQERREAGVPLVETVAWFDGVGSGLTTLSSPVAEGPSVAISTIPQGISSDVDPPIGNRNPMRGANDLARTQSGFDIQNEDVFSQKHATEYLLLARDVGAPEDTMYDLAAPPDRLFCLPGVFP